jgi:hypothetical protein
MLHRAQVGGDRIAPLDQTLAGPLHTRRYRLFAFAARFAQNTRPLCGSTRIPDVGTIFPRSKACGCDRRLAVIRVSPMKVPA